MEAIKIFRLVAKEFDKIPDEDVKVFMELYSDQISKKRFGKSYEKALAYLTAHKLKMSGYGDTESTGTISDSLRVSSYSEGETSISFCTSQGSTLQSDAEFALTVYGLEFLTLRRNAIIPIISASEA